MKISRIDPSKDETIQYVRHELDELPFGSVFWREDDVTEEDWKKLDTEKLYMKMSYKHTGGGINIVNLTSGHMFPVSINTLVVVPQDVTLNITEPCKNP